MKVNKLLIKELKLTRRPFDYVIYQMIINEVKPDLIIEIGSNIGGALYIADLLMLTKRIYVPDIVDMLIQKL
jgi:cephalosporin hydroxylase